MSDSICSTSTLCDNPSGIENPIRISTISPSVVAQYHDRQLQQPQQWQYLNRMQSRSKIGLGINRRTGRVQWCPGLTCCKLLLILPVIMLPVMIVLLVFMRIDGITFALSRFENTPKDQEQSYYMDDYEGGDIYVAPLDFDENQQQLHERMINQSISDRLSELEQFKRCVSFRYLLSEKNDIEEHDILKDARTSFLPYDSTTIPRECLKHLPNPFYTAERREIGRENLRHYRHRRAPHSKDNVPLHNKNANSSLEYDYEYGSSDLDTAGDESDEYKANPKIMDMVSALQNFWGDKSSKESTRRTQAQTMLKYIDRNVDPCHDFYKYACGNWAKLHPIPPDKAGFDTFEMLRENLDIVLKDLLESTDKGGNGAGKRGRNKVVDINNNEFDPHANTQADIVQPVLKDSTKTSEAEHGRKLIEHIISKRNVLGRVLRRYERQSTFRRRKRFLNLLSSYTSTSSSLHDEDAVRKARDFYKSCINVKLIQKRGIQPLLSLINSFGGWPVLDPQWNAKNFDWLNLTAQLRRFNNDIFIVEWVGPDIKNSDENVIQFDQTSLGLPTREYFLQDVNGKYLRAYQNFMSAIMQGLGAASHAAEKTASELIKFETRLAFITSPAEQRLNVTKLYKRMTIGQLKRSVPQIDWMRYLGILQERNIHENEPVVVYALDYMHRLVQLIDSTDKDTVSNYLMWRFIRHRINNVDDRFEDSKQNFYHTLFGREESPSRWKICIAQVNTNMGMALGSLFVRRYFDENSKLDTMKMTHELQQAFRDILKTTDWLDGKTKDLAELKVNAMSLKIGYPDFILNPHDLNEKYRGIVIHPDKYFENTLNVLLHTAKVEQLKLSEAVNKTAWQTAPAIVNAYYSRNKNQIMFPAGILQPPFYHRHFPRSLNFGGIGVVIGHELTHGFDDKGRLFDKNGSIHKWWTDASISGFDERARCIIAQYSNYIVDEIGVTLNGESTQGENIADNGGIRQAFHAYKRWLREHPDSLDDERLPGIDMTGEQLFFLNFGQVWCGAMRPEAIRNKLNTAIHSPGRFRVIGTISNSEDFAREFKCPPGSPMNPTNKCRVW